MTGSYSQNSGTFNQTGGTESGNPVGMTGGTLADSAGTGAFLATGSITLSGTVPTGQTVTGDGAGGSITLSVTSAATVDGTLTLESGSSGNSTVSGSGGSLTVASGGQLITEGSTDAVVIQVPLTNQSGGTVTIGAVNTAQNDTTLTTNDGTFTISSGGALNLGGSSNFTQAAGTLTVTGSYNQNSGTFTQSGGTESGNPVGMTGGTLADTAGSGAFLATGSITLSGTVPTGQTVTGDGAGGSITLNMNSAVTVDGTLTLESGSSGNSNVSGSGGSLTVASGGQLITEGSTDAVVIQVPLTNQSGGTVTIGAANTAQNDTTLTTNDGTFTISSGGALNLGGSSNFTQAAGTLTVTGSYNQNSGTFTQSGGTESGNPVGMTGGTLADSAGSGAFLATGSITLSGTVPTGQTVTGDGAGGSITLNMNSAVTVDGTLTLESGSSGNSNVSGSGGSLTVASGGQLITEGSTDAVVIQVPLTNQSGGTVTIGAADTAQNDTTLTTNSGLLQVLNGGHLNLAGSSTLSNTSSGTIGVTVNGTAGTGGISGPGVSLASGSTLSVTTVGSPAVSTLFTPISGPVTGTFTTFSFGDHNYAVTYPSSAVQLEVEPAFTTTATTLSPKENEALTTPELATIGSATDGTGTYSATVNYGDGSGVQTATVNITGASGTVTGPTHTYTVNGTYTVTTTVSNTDGQTNTVTDSVTIDGPVITGFSKDSVKQGKKLSTVVSGTGFDTSANFKASDPTDPWSVSNPGVTVVSAKFAKATKKKAATIKLKLSVSKTAATGPFNVTLTEDTGKYTVNNAITVVAS